MQTTNSIKSHVAVELIHLYQGLIIQVKMGVLTHPNSYPRQRFKMQKDHLTQSGHISQL